MKITFFYIILVANILANGWQEIHRAVYNEDYQKIEQIISNNIDSVNDLTTTDLTPLHLAVKMRNFNLVEFFLKSGAEIDAQDKKGRTPLLYAISQRQTKLAKFLISNGADYNLANNEGVSPLHQASYSGDIEIVKFLLNIGVKGNLGTKNGSTSYQIAITRGNYRIADYLKFYNQSIKQ
jgi:ankyrin repeat protein